MGNKQAKPTKASAPSPSRAKASSEDASGVSAQQQAPPPAPAPAPTPAATQQQTQQAAAPVAAASAFAAPPPPPPQQQQPRPPRAPVPVAAPARSQLEAKLAQVDVAAMFSTSEILSIRKHLAAVLGLREDDAIVIPKDEFFRFLVGNSASSLYVNRLYAIFDMDKKGYVTFEDLMKGLSMLSQHASREHKLLLSFYLLDPEGTGFITKSMTTALLRSCLAECKELDISLSDEQVARIVDSTFEEADLDRNDLIDLHEYQALDAKHPGLFDFLTVDAFGVINHLEKVHSMSITAGH